MPQIAPSILAADFSRLKEQILEAEQGGAELFHLDVMDGQFVPNISFGFPIIEACRRTTTQPLDVHLMIAQPERYIAQTAKAGADNITFHAEATSHAHRVVQLIKEQNKTVGLAINPGTPLAELEPLLNEIDIALVMSVNPGFGGQKFIASSLERMRQVQHWREARRLNFRIEVDGGVNTENIHACISAGADILVAGSSVFNNQASVAENITELKKQMFGSVNA